jgi:hypothetical protein
MTRNEREILLALAQITVQSTIELSFYREQSGEISLIGHPRYDALTQHFLPLLAQVASVGDVSEDAQKGIYTALQELLKAVKILRQS